MVLIQSLRAALKENIAYMCFRRAVSCFYNVSDLRNVFSIQRGAGEFHFCVMWTIVFRIWCKVERSQNRLLAAKTETRTQVQIPEEIAGMRSKRDQRKCHAQKLGSTVRLLSPHCSAKSTSFLDDVRRENGPVFEDLYSIPTSEPLLNLHLEVSKSLDELSHSSTVAP